MQSLLLPLGCQLGIPLQAAADARNTLGAENADALRLFLLLGISLGLPLTSEIIDGEESFCAAAAAAAIGHMFWGHC